MSVCRPTFLICRDTSSEIQPPHHWYKTLGYNEVGVIPGWTIGPQGERYDHITLYRELKADP